MNPEGSTSQRQRTAAPDQVPRVGVWPPEARGRRQHLFDALEEAFDVRIEGGTRPHDAGTIRFVADGDSPPRASEPVLSVPVLSLPMRHESGGTGRVRLALHEGLDSRLRGASLDESAEAPAAELPRRGASALAIAGDEPVWVRRRREGGSWSDRSALGLDELAEGEALRDRFRAGRFLALLPVLELLRAASGYDRARAPRLRAAFVLDDPNLHWPSYGHVRYPELARSAALHGYHVAMATVPIDGWLAHPRAVRWFRGPGAHLSLAIHGNQHVARELERPGTAEEADRLLTHALARVERLERRAGVRVARVMVPPHGACSEEAMRGLARVGFEGAAIGRPFPWVARRGDSPFAHPLPHRPLTGWHPADVVGGGVPVLLRRALTEPRDELALSAYLDQPVIVYGHHGDLAGGPDLLEETAAYVNSLGEAVWSGLETIARSGFGLAHDGELARVTLYSRRAHVPIDHGVKTLEVGWPSCFDVPDGLRCRIPGLGFLQGTHVPHGSGMRFELPTGATPATAELIFPTTSSRPVPNVRARPWPVVRRLLSEARDRVDGIRKPQIRRSQAA